MGPVWVGNATTADELAVTGRRIPGAQTDDQRTQQLSIAPDLADSVSSPDRHNSRPSEPAVDIWSTAVVGFCVRLTGPNWNTAKVSLFNAAADPACSPTCGDSRPLEG